MVYRGTMRGGHIAVGVQHARVCVVEATDPTPVDQISIVARELERPNLTSGDACRLASFGHRRRRGRRVLDTSGCVLDTSGC